MHYPTLIMLCHLFVTRRVIFILPNLILSRQYVVFLLTCTSIDFLMMQAASSLIISFMKLLSLFDSAKVKH